MHTQITLRRFTWQVPNFILSPFSSDPSSMRTMTVLRCLGDDIGMNIAPERQWDENAICSTWAIHWAYAFRITPLGPRLHMPEIPHLSGGCTTKFKHTQGEKRVRALVVPDM